MKAALAIGALIGGLALDAVGFPRELSQNPSLALHLPARAVMELGIAAGPLPAVISVVTLVLLLFYRINRAQQARISEALALRRARGGS